MKSLYELVVRPVGERYNNSKKVGDKELILNTEIFNHSFVNRVAEVISVPVDNPFNIELGEQLIIHHNVFRRWHDVKGNEKNSRGFLNEGEYFVSPDQVYMRGKPGSWKAIPGYTFVKPLKSIDDLDVDDERPLVGIVKYSDGTFLPTQLVGFCPSMEFEFIIDGERLYRIMNKFINIEYEYKGNEEEYNPSWA